MKEVIPLKTFFHVLLIFLTLFILSNGSLVLAASSKALILWFEALLPSMFVSMVFIKWLVAIDAFSLLLKPLNTFTKFLFKLDSQAFSLVLVGSLIGFPAFAMMIDELIQKGELNQEAGQRLIYCVSCASCSFILITLGSLYFQSLKIGIILYIIQLLTIFILLIFTRNNAVEFTNSHHPFIFKAFTSALLSSIKTMVMIVGYLMISLSLVSLLLLILPQGLHTALYTLAEFSSGTINLATSSFATQEKYMLISGLLSFAGFSVHLQVMGSCEHTSLNYLTYLNYRLIQSILAVILSFIIFIL